MDISKGQTAKLLFPVLLLIKSVIFSEHCVDDVIVQYNLKRIITVCAFKRDDGVIVCCEVCRI